ncbi:MAG: SprB repeat-containing protein [Bacteroidetes bacterium]|nr:SprB repeat-containing protein [Bacteroidota bacterium]
MCPGQNTGIAVATGMGASPWDYVWTNSAGTVLLTQNNVAGTSTLNSLAPGSYTVSVTDNNGCTSGAAFTITAAPAFSAVMNTTNLTCNNSNNGTASLVINGGTPGYTYAWSPAGTGANPIALAANNYTVTITDANGCTTLANGTITQPAIIVASTVTKTNVDCNGGQNGSITVTTAGGTPGYTYSWSTGAAGPTISSLTAGAYTVTVTDSRGCTGFMTVGISQPTPIVLAMSSTAASCGTNNGTASVAALGGTPGYTYAWSPSGGTTSFASGLAAGGYNVTVTDNAGCTMLGNAVVSNSSGPTTTIASSVNVTCFGGNNGSATANVVGGAAPIVYNWTPSGGSGISASGLSAGNYTVTATDGAGCTSAASVVISSPLQLTATISNSVPVSCSYENDGSLSVSGNGGTPAYSYVWSGGSVNATDNNLLPGTYTVTITDIAGCTASTSGTVTAPTLLQINISSNTPVSCNLGNDGSTTVTAVGGTAGYTYLWSNGTVGATNSGLTAGTYTVTATDANGCIATQSVVLSQSTALNVVPSSTGTTCGSANGTTSVVVNGGTPGYSYSWSPSGGTNSSATGLNAGNYSVLVTDANGCTSIGNISVPSANGPVLNVLSSNNITCPGGNDGDISINVAGGAIPYSYSWSNGGVGTSISSLSAGIYTLTVTDNNSCSSSIIVNLTEPNGFTFVDVSNTAHCGQADGDLSITASGGTSPYTYSWSNGVSGSNQITNVVSGTYTVTVSDVNGCTAVSSGVIADAPAPTITLNNSFDASCFGGADGRIRVNVAGGIPPYNLLWSNGTVGSLNSNIAAGTYTVTVTDAVGCTATFQSSISEPTAINLVPSSTLATCGSSNGSASVVANGGTGGYAYAWSPIGGNAAAAANLGAGSYTVVVTDANGCTEQMNVNVGSSNGPSAVVLLQTDISCNGGNDGALTISVNGGAVPYVYAWSASGSGTSGVGLTAGIYSVTVTDDNGCSSMVSATINEPTALSTVPNSYTSHCGQADGGADILVNGGTPIYAYNWSTGTSVNNTLSNVSAGSYTVLVSDANGCTFATTVNIPDQVGPVVNIATSNQVTCNGGNDGSVSVGIVGGNNPFNYVWSNGASSAANSNLTAGNYTVTITDAFGCTSTLVANITEPAIIPLAFVNTISTCGSNNGSSTVTPNGGTAPYSYSWSNGSVSSIANALSAGVYTVTVTDAQGCSVSDNTIINSAGGPTLLSGGQTDVSCAGGADGTASVLVTAGNGPFTFDWLPSGGITANATGLSAGNYKVSVTDINGCSTTLNYNILEPLPLIVNNLTTPVTCNGGNDGTANIDAQDGTAPYVYDWNPGGISTANRINLSAGNYDVTVTDAKGCTEQTQAVVAEPQAISGVPAVVDADCFGGNTGSASIVATGGLSPYTFYGILVHPLHKLQI